MSHLVCYCFRVEKDTLVAAIENGCDSVEDLSRQFRVCTGCGGCRPDVEDLLRFYRNENESSGPRNDPEKGSPT